MSLLHRTPTRDEELPELTPAQLAELDALDAALAGDETADDAIATLVRDVRAAAPELGTDGAQRMNDRLGVALDPVGARRASRLRGLLHGPSGVAASLLLVVVIGGGTAAYMSGSGSTGGGLSDSVSSSDEAMGAAAAPELATVTGSSPEESDRDAAGVTRQSRDESTTRFLSKEEGAATSTPDTASSKLVPRSALADTDRAGGRAVEYAVDLGVRVKNGELPEAAKQVATITRQANGYVANSSVNLGRAGAGNAAFALRVDASQLDRAVDRLGGLGTVTSQNETSQDITSSLDSAERQLADARKDREALLRALSKAQAADEIASVRRQIAANRATLARLDAAVTRVERRAQLTTIQLSLEAPTKGDPSADDGNWTLGDAAGDAWVALRAILGALLVGAAVVAPFALIGGAGYAVWHRRRRTARERTLDA